MDSIKIDGSASSKITIDSNDNAIDEYAVGIVKADVARLNSLQNLMSQVDKVKLHTCLTRIRDVINTGIEEGCFSCIISNDMLEDLFSTEEESFDDALIQYVVHFLQLAGYKVKYDELIYNDISNLIEISW